VTAEGGSEVKIVVPVKDSILVLGEVNVEGTGSLPGPGPSPSPGSCLVNGGKVGQGIELEGNVSSGDYQAFKMSAAGANGLVDVSAAAASFRCIGNAKVPNRCRVQAGGRSWRPPEERRWRCGRRPAFKAPLYRSSILRPWRAPPRRVTSDEQTRVISAWRRRPTAAGGCRSDRRAASGRHGRVWQFVSASRRESSSCVRCPGRRSGSARASA